jgi:hypothetical protein
MTSILHKSKKIIAVISQPSVLANWLAAIVSSSQQKQVVRSRPLTVRIAPANYASLRDGAVREFLASPIVCAAKHADKRVQVLTENPYDHETHSHALSQFTKQQHEIL